MPSRTTPTAVATGAGNFTDQNKQILVFFLVSRDQAEMEPNSPWQFPLAIPLGNSPLEHPGA
jgi:hypothetical protein